MTPHCTVVTGVLAALVAGPVGARTPRSVSALASGGSRGELLAVERQRLDAEVMADVPAIGGFIANDVVYQHGDGERQTRGEYLAAVASGKSRYSGIATHHRSADVEGRIGITHGDVTLDLATGQQVVAHYTGVYRQDSGRWFLLSWQSTPIEDAQAKAAAERE